MLIYGIELPSGLDSQVAMESKVFQRICEGLPVIERMDKMRILS